MNKERLLKLADHLEHGKLGHKVFDFTKLNYNDISDENRCGTNGCAIGECPIVFPEFWQFSKEYAYSPLLKSDHHFGDSFSCATEFFEISFYDADYLFIPSEDDDETNPEDSDGFLNAKSTKEEVAARIREFVGGIK